MKLPSAVISPVMMAHSDKTVMVAITLDVVLGPIGSPTVGLCIQILLIYRDAGTRVHLSDPFTAIELHPQHNRCFS